MQFGIFSVGDVTTDPTTGHTITEAERIQQMVTLALTAEQVGLDVFATGEHHNPPFVPSSPTTMLGYVAARTERIILSTATTLITTNDPVKIAEDYAVLQHLVRRPRRPDDGPRQHGAGLSLVRPGHPQRDPARDRELRAAPSPVARGRRRLVGPVPDPADGLHRGPPPARRHPAVRVARLDPQSRDRRAGRLLRRRLLPQQHLLAVGPRPPHGRPLPAAVRALRARPGRPGDRRPRRAGVHARGLAGGHPRVPAVLRRTRRSTAAGRRSRTTSSRRR